MFKKWTYSAENKTKTIYIGTSNKKRVYTLHGIDIPEIDEQVRDLGLHFQPSLKWDKHISRACRNAYCRWFNLYKFFKTTDSRLFIRLYKCYVRPLLEFGSILFNQQSQNLSNTLESVQRKITRMIFKRCFPKDYPDSLPPYADRCKILQIDTIQFRMNVTDLTLLHSLRLEPNLIQPRNRPTTLKLLRSHRYKGIFAHSHVRTSLRQKSFFIRSTKNYNKLPKCIVENSCHKSFRKEITSFLRDTSTT